MLPCLVTLTCQLFISTMNIISEDSQFSPFANVTDVIKSESVGLVVACGGGGGVPLG
jgi:hypothetical protein